MTEKGYKRKGPRVERIFLTSVSRHHDTGELASSFVGKTLNLSDGGIMIEITEPVPLLSKVDIKVALEEYILDVKGEVVHLRKIENGHIEMGVKFLDFSDDGLKKIRNFVH
ncbi:hypothetical protein MNBD_NITROSPINAE02-1969 [hydrothermal vent metagenome]|uniref:PilZ domain-containing protein n=1 Tax=hydrothermal vent metagenome TaxID=652676 RepID=A0A3B1CVN1_9ZZZZ